ncbi:hypothetical protein HY970_03670 [Candidatus Kaiserbacteria bacterium]|nr:hypothetical protein [Candidatus Kaiserbacteria bacterium]
MTAIHEILLTVSLHAGSADLLPTVLHNGMFCDTDIALRAVMAAVDKGHRNTIATRAANEMLGPRTCFFEARETVRITIESFLGIVPGRKDLGIYRAHVHTVRTYDQDGGFLWESREGSTRFTVQRLREEDIDMARRMELAAQSQ